MPKNIYPREMKTYVQTQTCTPMVIAVLVIIAKSWKLLKCPSTDKWIKKMWNIIQLLKEMNYWYTLQHGWTLQTLTERNQTWKTTYYVIPRVRTVQNRHIFRDRKQTSGYLGLGEGNGEWLLLGMRFLFWMMKCAELRYGDGCTTLWMY